MCGGAGHVRFVAEHWDDVLRMAAELVSGQCGGRADGSCYGCLKSYGNQRVHDQLAHGLTHGVPSKHSRFALGCAWGIASKVMAAMPDDGRRPWETRRKMRLTHRTATMRCTGPG